MAAVTETAGTRRETITGHSRMVKVDVTAVDDTDTWTPGLAIIDMFTYAPALAGAGTQWGATWTSPASRQGVVTIALESGTLTGSFMAWGS